MDDNKLMELFRIIIEDCDKKVIRIKELLDGLGPEELGKVIRLSVLLIGLITMLPKKLPDGRIQNAVLTASHLIYGMQALSEALLKSDLADIMVFLFEHPVLKDLTEEEKRKFVEESERRKQDTTILNALFCSN